MKNVLRKIAVCALAVSMIAGSGLVISGGSGIAEMPVNAAVSGKTVLPQDNGSILVNNQGVGGSYTSTWVNWNNITAKANFKGEGGWKYKYSYKNDKDNKWVELTGYIAQNSYRLPKFTQSGNYTIRIAAVDKYG